MTEINLPQVISRFEQAEHSWLSTVRPDGRSHVVPIWHAWYRNRVYLVIQPASVKANNIRRNPNIVIAHPDPSHAIIFEGKARLVDGMVPALQPLFKAKYDWDIAADAEYTAVVEITPAKLMAWGEEGAGKRKVWTGDEIIGAASPD